GVLHHRAVPAAPARAPAAHDLAAGRPGPGGAGAAGPDLHPLTRYHPMRAKLLFAVTGLLTLPAYATELEISVEIPKLNVAEYHRPYVAVWIEGSDSKAVADLAVWYQMKETAEGHGTKWLPDLRQWWRKSGRNLDLPVDGVTGPTRPVGRHTIEVDAATPSLKKLP